MLPGPRQTSASQLLIPVASHPDEAGTVTPAATWISLQGSMLQANLQQGVCTAPAQTAQRKAGRAAGAAGQLGGQVHDAGRADPGGVDALADAGGRKRCSTGTVGQRRQGALDMRVEPVGGAWICHLLASFIV